MIVSKINIDKKDKILIVAPHPDDECIGAGGLIVKYPELCDVLVLTDGRHGRDDISEDEEAVIRKQQFEAAMSFAGIQNVFLLDYEDGKLICYPYCMEDFSFNQYTKVFLPYGDDDHIDHSAAFFYAMDALRKVTGNIEIYQYEVHAPMHYFTHYLDISKQVTKKQELIAFHKDQVAIIDFSSMTKALGRYRACQLGKPEGYAEVYSYCPKNKYLYADTMAKEQLLKKYQATNNVLRIWLEKALLDNSSESLKKIKGKRVSIYGYTDIGRLLYKFLEQHNIMLCDYLDRAPKEDITKHPADGDKTVNLVVVSILWDFTEIKNELHKLGYKNIVSIADVVI